MASPTLRCTAFAGSRRIASGELRHVALKAKKARDLGQPVLVFEDASGRQVDLPLELPAADLLKHLVEPLPPPPAVAAPRGCSASWMQRAICAVIFSCTWKRRAKASTTRASLLMPTTLPSGK